MNMSIGNSQLGNEAIQRILCGGKKVYFVGIGGIGMQGLAVLLKKRGYTVWGSDRAESKGVCRLRSQGIDVHVGHRAAGPAGADLVVYTLALSPDNPELLYAQKAGIPCISRAELLGWVMSGYRRRVAVAGMHGKSTVTGMLAAAMRQANPTVISGAPLCPDGEAYRLGGNDLFLCEACEYMDSFLKLQPDLSIALNMEMEHVDYFRSEEQLSGSFSRYLHAARQILLPCDCSALSVLAAGRDREDVFRFGTASDADARAERISWHEGCARFRFVFRGREAGNVSLALPGEHNLRNALAALGAAAILGADLTQACEDLSAFRGVGRRLEKRGIFRGMTIYTDYAHHPTEITASLAALRGVMGKEGRLFCAFQPHTYSRTEAFADRFAQALSAADRVYMLPIYAAREENLSGICAKDIADRIPGACTVCGEELEKRLTEEGRAGDFVVLMGAGDIDRWAERLTEA